MIGDKNTGVIIQARMSSTRLPAKVLLHLADEPIICHVYNRAKLYFSNVIVATSDDPSDDLLVRELDQYSIPYFRGSLENVLKRFIDCAVSLGWNKIVRITADNPLVNYNYLVQNWESYKGYLYVDAIHKNGLIYGTGFEVVSLAALEMIKSDSIYYKEHVTAYLRESKIVETLSVVPPLEMQFSSSIFLTCDYPEDYEVLNNIFNCLSPHDLLEIKVVRDFYFKSNLGRLNSKMSR